MLNRAPEKRKASMTALRTKLEARHNLLPPLGKVVGTSAELEHVVEELSRSEGLLALDIETFGPAKSAALDPWEGEMRILTVCGPGCTPWVIDIQDIGADLAGLVDILQARELVIHNAIFDVLWLRVKLGIEVSRVFCTLTASRLLTAGSTQKNDLASCLERNVGIRISKDLGRTDWGQRVLTAEQIRYAAEDVAHLHLLSSKLQQELLANNLGRTSALEMALIPIVVNMRACGFPVDPDRMKALSVAARDDLHLHLRAARAILGTDINLESPQQVKKALARQGVYVHSTRRDTLAMISHPAAIALQSYRASAKVVKQIEVLQKHIKSDGRIHACFVPTGADTGRFSCASPNLQNVGRGELRSCFLASHGHVLVIADYSQIELRVAAVIAGENRMLDAYRQDVDLHKQTAAIVLRKSLAAVTPEDRQLAKAVNFGLLYGQGARGLVRYANSAFGVTLPLQMARTM